MYSILITEDDGDLRANLKRILSLEGYKVYSAKNGINAYEKILIHRPDLIISDIQMQYVNGFELLKALLENPETSSIPFVFLTGETNSHKVDEALSMGARYYITKPFDLNFLLSTIKSAIEDGGKYIPFNT